MFINNWKAETRILMLFYFRFRFMVGLLISLCLGVLIYVKHSFFYTQLMHSRLAWFYFNIRKSNKLIDTIIDNLALLIDGQLKLFARPFLFATSFFLVILVIKSVASKIRPIKLANTVLCFMLLVWVYFYYLLLGFSVKSALIIYSFIALVYICNYVLLESKLLNYRYPKILLALFFMILIGLAEIFFTPLYIRFLTFLKGKERIKPNKLLIRNFHFFSLVFLVILFTTPISREYDKGFIKLTNAETYGLKISPETSKLFFVNISLQQLQLLNLDAHKKHFNSVYPTEEKAISINKKISSSLDVLFEESIFDEDKISDQVEINKEKGEIYLIDRSNRKLIILNLYNYMEIGSISSEGFDLGGDSYLLSEGNLLFIANEDPLYIYKIDITIPKIIIQKNINFCTNALAYDKTNNSLYLVNSQSNYPEVRSYEYYLFEIDADTLNIKRMFLLPGESTDLVLTADGKKLFCNIISESLFSSSVYVFDTGSLGIIDKIKVPWGTRSIAIDEQRQILFAGSAATNLIEIIDLKNKRLVGIYRPGRFSLRQIALDEKRRKFYVSTQHFGLFQGEY